ncbi:ABC transporter ATP-binding protein [Kribbella capetownensis]|uniref:ABC transporter ATP-binding protein n=1 Tax=Kribbella capetownensis TaxID=1572659 RepID=A0A4V2M4W3_9ACTN|nr:ABC transporter ATP-binding protein [Kribbella capetownensis]TCC37492.1 ABC transporter ATP-binding protein [Kribbella capetownensis]
MADAVDARGLVRTFDDGTGVRGVDIRVAPGEIHALVGLNGAGKSTLMRLLLGMLKPDRGTVAIAGRSLEGADWTTVGHLVDYPLAYGELTCRQNLALGARLHGVAPAAIEGIVDAAIEELHLGQYAGRRAGKLSLGNKQRLGLASALQHSPRFIVLDEPTNTLDPAGVILLREALLRRSDTGAGVFVSSHHLDEVARVADRISVLNAGRIIGTLDPHGIDIERSFFELVHSDDVTA